MKTYQLLVVSKSTVCGLLGNAAILAVEEGNTANRGGCIQHVSRCVSGAVLSYHATCSHESSFPFWKISKYDRERKSLPDRIIVNPSDRQHSVMDSLTPLLIALCFGAPFVLFPFKGNIHPSSRSYTMPHVTELPPYINL